MAFLWWGRKKENFKEEIKASFDKVKNDFAQVGQWIKYLDSLVNSHAEELSKLKQDVEEIKQFISFFGTKVFRHPQGLSNKQTAVQAVQTPVYTAVYTPIQAVLLKGLTSTERLIVWALLNTDLKLSYEDLSVLLGKDKSTIRSQINSIKQKNEALLSEVLERNGKKRYFIEPKVKEMLFKQMKVRAATNKIKEKRRKSETSNNLTKKI